MPYKETYITDKSTHTNALIQQNVHLSDKAWFKTGGNAQYYAKPRTNEQFLYTIKYAQNHDLTITVLGAGANCLISDNGIRGLVIHPHINTIIHHNLDKHTTYVTAGAGALLADVITCCLSHNRVGLEEFSGIPGTIGGSVYINLHYFNFLLEQFISSATIFDTVNNSIKTVSSEWFNFSYDYSKLHEKKQFLLDATFKLTKVTETETAFARGRSQEIIRHRMARYPYTGTCGSFFRNFHDDEVTMIRNNKKMIYSAYYLDKFGVKGFLQCGNAVVSHQHANMIVNQGNANTQDIITIARTMQRKVFDQFGILLQPECELMGFDIYPLHTLETV